MLTSQSNHQRVVELNPSDTSGRQDISKKLKGHSNKTRSGCYGSLIFQLWSERFYKANEAKYYEVGLMTLISGCQL